MNDRALAVATIPALAVMSEDELCHVLQNSIYPGAALASVKLVIGYCKSQGLDPMTKPVHIVPMDVKTDKKKQDGSPIYEKRDVIMPGIELYRTKATTTGRYLGCSKPMFGPMLKLKFKEKRWEDNPDGSRSERTKENEIEYPEWCEMTVKRMVDGQVCEFTALEYWVENYATQSNYSDAPNKMWKKRTRGQLVKCTEAQALRKAFPDAIGAAPTAEEMEGKSIDDGNVIDGATGALVQTAIPGPQAKSAAAPKQATTVEGESRREPDPKPAGESDEASPKADSAAPAGEGSGDDKPMLEGQMKIIRAKLKNAALSDSDLIAKFGKIEELKFGQFAEIQSWIAERAEKLAG